MQFHRFDWFSTHEIHLTIIPQARVGYEMTDSERWLYTSHINTRRLNNCLVYFITRTHDIRLSNTFFCVKQWIKWVKQWIMQFHRFDWFSTHEIHLTIIPQARVGYEMTDSERWLYTSHINTRRLNNCLVYFITRTHDIRLSNTFFCVKQWIKWVKQWIMQFHRFDWFSTHEIHLTIIPQARVGYEMTDSERGA